MAGVVAVEMCYCKGRRWKAGKERIIHLGPGDLCFNFVYDWEVGSSKRLHSRSAEEVSPRSE